MEQNGAKLSEDSGMTLGQREGNTMTLSWLTCGRVLSRVARGRHFLLQLAWGVRWHLKTGTGSALGMY